MSKKAFLIIFFVLFFLGTFLRFYQLGTVPASLDWDEASWGYNAYSVLHTGKDEFGEVLPLSFRAFGDYKQPVYAYATAASVAAFNLTAFAVRFPTAVAGTLSIILVYLFTYEVFRKQKYARTVALLTMGLFAISPWSILFSRIAFETNVGQFFILLGSWFFICGLHKGQNWYYFAGIIAISLSTYTYHGDKLFAPLLFLALLVYGWKKLITKKSLLVMLIIFFGLCNIFWLMDSRTTTRGRSVLFTADQTKLLSTPIKEQQYDKEHGDKIGELFHNRRVVFVEQFVKNYLAHFNPNWLYIDGDNPRHHTPGMGVLYLANVPFLLLGIFYLLKYNPSAASIIFLWLLFAPVASALAVDAPSASRSFAFLPTWQIFEAFGWWYAISALKNTRWRYLLLIPVILLLINVIYFLHQYFIHTNTEVQKDWQYGYKEAVISSEMYNKSNRRVFFSKNFEQVYAYYLFYTQYDPQKYIQAGGSTRTNKKCYAIDNVYFGDCQDKIRRGDIVILTGVDSKINGKELKQVNYITGEVAVRVFEYE